MLATTGLHAARPLAQELDGEYSIVGGAKTKLDDNRTGNVSEQANLLRYVISPQLGEGPLLRLGGEWKRFSFGLPDSAPLPNTLQSFAAVVGLDMQLFDSWLIRIEARPGFYSGSGDITKGSFNVPFILGCSYLASADLQWVAGASVDVNRKWPFIPAVGVRWKMSEKWVLNGILPRPRLEYDWDKSLKLFLGGDVKGATYRVDAKFGDAHGNPRLNNAIVEYWEVRAGVGATWKVSSNWTAEIGTGYMAYRNFDFHRAGSEYKTDLGAAYGEVVLGGRF